MSSGKVHHRYWKLLSFTSLIFAACLAIAFYLLTRNYLYSGVSGACVIVGYFLGGICSPDLDQIGISDDEGRAMRTFGCLGVAWTMFWMPYAYVMRFVGVGKKGHRNFFSHTPYISTFIRLVYLLWLPTLVYWYFYVIDPELIYGFVGLNLGLGISDSIHWMGDFL